MTVIDQEIQSISDWMDREKLGSLVLPAGPFGAPGDLFRFSGVSREQDSLTLILEGQMFVVLQHPTVALTADEVAVSGTIDFRWKEFGRERWHEENLGWGTVRLRRQISAPHLTPNADGAFGVEWAVSSEQRNIHDEQSGQD